MKIDSLNSMQYGSFEYQKLQKTNERDTIASDNPDNIPVKSSISTLLERSINFESEAADVVQQAKEALSTGELDRPEAIRDAASQMIRSGI